MVIRHTNDSHWESVSVLKYKEEGSHFKDITRQVLFDGSSELPCQLRYFEISPGGHSSLEHHEHVHVVFILKGEGDVLVGGEVHRVSEKDVVTIPRHAWHQFQADRGGPLGFLCLVNVQRDRPNLPTPEDLQSLRHDPRIAAFIKT
jgi:quercetin dioxygenase-like cupin family protein